MTSPSHSGSFTLSWNHRGNLPELMKTLLTLNPYLLRNSFVLNRTVCTPNCPLMRPFSLFYDCAQVVVLPTWYLFSWRHCVQVICARVTVSRVPLLTHAYELKSSLSASSCSYLHQTRTVWFKLLFTHSFEVWPLELDKH